jgi:tRNA uridine 5-carboxymethylaminomethyl modification enzyme
VDDAAWQRLQDKERAIGELNEYLRTHRHDGDSLETWLRRTEIDWDHLARLHAPLASMPVRPDVREQVVLQAKYSGYIGRQAAEVERFRKLESRPIPATFAYDAVPQLRVEAREKLSRVRPATLGQASRISGISPADLAVLLIYLDD